MFNDSLKARARAAFNSAKAKAVAVGGTAMVASGSALATPGGFDSSAITSAITSNVATAVVVIGAFIVGVWTLRAMGLLKRG